MSGIQLKVLPKFPAQVTGVAPIVVEKSGLSYTISYDAVGADLAVAQIKQKLVSINQFDTINNSMTGGPANAAVMVWTGGGLTQRTGPLLTSIFTTLGYTTAQKDAFIADAALYPY